MGPKKKGKKKKEKKNEEEEKAKREAEEKAAEEARAAEKLRIEQEKEAEAKALAEKIAKAKKEMLDCFEREKFIVLPDDIVKPYEMWGEYETTKEAIWYAVQAGVEPDADEFVKLRSRADEEKEILSRFDYKAFLEEINSEPTLGTHNGPKVPGTLDADERFLVKLWQMTGGSTGNWNRDRGWKHIGTWEELCEKWIPEERVLQPPLKKGETLAVTIDEIVKKSLPVTEGVVVHRSRVQNISLFSNNLVGTIPTNIGMLTHLKILNLHNNGLSGIIPIALTQCNILQRLDLCKNSLTGPIPKNFGSSLTQLRYLHLENNQLTGPLPKCFSKMIHLTEFTAHWNKLNGRLPVDIGECRKLTLLSLHHNRLTGFVPESLTQCVKLKQLLLVKNKLIGSVPPAIYTNCDITSTPRSKIHMKCQVFPSKSPDSDSEAESIIKAANEEYGGEDGYEGQYYEEQYNEGTNYDEYIGYAGEYTEEGAAGASGTDYAATAGADEYGQGGEIVPAQEYVDPGYEADQYQEVVEEVPGYGEAELGYEQPAEASGYYDEQGNWVEGYYDEAGNWINTGQDWDGGGYGY